MQLPASKRPEARVPFVAGFTLAVVAAALLGAADAAASGPVAETPPAGLVLESHPYAKNLPNVVLKTHEGKAVRFYDDLVKGKVVMINFMYAQCKGR